MSNFNVFTIPQLKKICVHTGISNFIKFSVSKPELIQQIEKYLDFDGYNFTIKETNQQQFLQSDLLKKVHKPKISSKDKKILQIAKKEIQDIKGDVNTIKDYIDEYMKNIAKNAPKEIYPKKPKKKINLKKAKSEFKKLIKSEEDFGIDPDDLIEPDDLEEIVFQKIIKPIKKKKN